jgi:hypothetical protein
VSRIPIIDSWWVYKERERERERERETDIVMQTPCFFPYDALHHFRTLVARRKAITRLAQ